MARPYRVISADSHLELLPERWTKFVDAKHRDRAPRTVKLPNGGDAFLVEGREAVPAGLNVQGGRAYEDFDPVGVTYEGTPGTGTPEQRVSELDQDGVDAEVLYAGLTGPQTSRTIKDGAAYQAMIRGYNMWLAEEYCAVAPDRLLGMGAIPVSGLEDALAEVQFCKDNGLKGVELSAFPSGNSFPLPEDDAFWAKSLAIGMPLTIHVSMDFGSGGGGNVAWKYPSDLAYAGPPGGDVVRNIASYGMRGALNAVQLTMAGVFDRFPEMRMYFAENEAGWVPMFLEEMDNRYVRHKGWAERHYGMPPLKQLPSEYILEHVYWGFLRDPFGVRIRDDAGGAGHLLWGLDFPHYNSDWPHSSEIRDLNFKGVSAEERYRMECGNVIDYFHLPNSVNAPG